MRLLTATFTVSPLAFSYDATPSATDGRPSDEDANNSDGAQGAESENVITILASTLPNILRLLTETDRATPVFSAISAQVLGPTFRSRRFPYNVNISTIEILKISSKLPDTSKGFRKDVSEAFNDARFFCQYSLTLASSGWIPILKQWMLIDKDRMSEILTRLSAPTSAGIMFGVGASSARLEADRKAQLNLRRVTLMVLAGDFDECIVNINLIQEKVTELLHATQTSSSSSTARAELYLLMRALILKVSPIHLAWLWPILNGELRESLATLSERDGDMPSNINCVLQAARLLDMLLTVSPEDFQLREWLFVTDTIDAVYRTPEWKAVALVDNLANQLDAADGGPSSNASTYLTEPHHDGEVRRPLLRWELIQNVAKGREMIDKVLRPFLRQLSIITFESTYRMDIADRNACEEELLRDLFDESTLV